MNRGACPHSILWVNSRRIRGENCHKIAVARGNVYALLLHCKRFLIL